MAFLQGHRPRGLQSKLVAALKHKVLVIPLHYTLQFCRSYHASQLAMSQGRNFIMSSTPHFDRMRCL